MIPNEMRRLPRERDPFELDPPWAGQLKDVRVAPKVRPRPAPRQTPSSTFEEDLQRVLRIFAQ